MTKHEYLSTLESKLRVLPYSEKQDALEYYDGYLSDAENEAAAIAELGSPGEVAANILANYVAKEPVYRTHPHYRERGSGGLKIALVITLALFALPIGLPLIIAVAALAFSLIITFGSLVFAFGLTAVGLIVGGIVGIVSFPFFAFQAFGASLQLLGMSIASIGLGILFFKLTVWVCGGFSWIARFVGNIISRRNSHGRQAAIQQ